MTAIQSLQLDTISTGEPTYWPADIKKKPDLLNFFIIKGIANTNFVCETCFDMSSDRSPVVVTLSRKIVQITENCRLHNRKIDWTLFQQLLTSSLYDKLPLKTDEDITEAVEYFSNYVQKSAWEATPILVSDNKTELSLSIREKIREKCQARKHWPKTRYPNDRKRFNQITSQLKQFLSIERNQGIQTYLKNLDATTATDYSLWKTVKKLKQLILSHPPIRKVDNTWAR